VGTPQSFEVYPLDDVARPRSPAVLAFQKQTWALQRAMLGAGAAAGEAMTRAANLLTALKETPDADASLSDDVRALQDQIREVLHLGNTVVPVDLNLTELGLDSLMVMELIRRMEKDLALRLFPREILERPSIQELAVYLAHELGANRQTAATTGTPAASKDVFAAIAQNISPNARTETQAKNSTLVFLLSAPRSGSTLLRVMLAGHPMLFSPPELHLLSFSSMQQRQEKLGITYLDEGLLMSVMKLLDFSVDESKQLVSEWIEQDLSIQEVYGNLQNFTAGRLLVDKSPTYGLNPETLNQAELLFDNPKYIYLRRHPYPAIESAARVRFDKLFGAKDIDPYVFGEQIWTTLNQNISHFLKGIESDRCHSISFEHLVENPEAEMTRLCKFLDIPFDEAVIKPYEGDRMTGGIYDVSISLGDENLTRRTQIDASLGQVWKEIKLPIHLSPETKAVAQNLGYQLLQDDLTHSQNTKMEPLVPIHPNGTKRPFYLIHPGSGLVYLFYELGLLLGSDQPFYGLQDPSLSGDREPHTRVEDFAKEYLAAIRKVQPTGPYRIGGWSFGGHIAIEMARILKAEGQKIDLLLVIDSEAVLAGRQPTLRQRVNFSKNRLIDLAHIIFDIIPYVRDGFYLTVMRRKIGEDHPAANISRLEYAQWAWSDAMYKMFARRAGIEEIISRDASFLRMRIPNIRRVFYVLGRHLQVMRQYHPEKYQGDLTFIRADDQVSRQFFTDETLGWTGLVSGQVELHHVPGNHLSIFKKPNIQVLASTIRSCLDKTET